jgi:glycosyltransferase involved in cell wall biosynthesis
MMRGIAEVASNHGQPAPLSSVQPVTRKPNVHYFGGFHPVNESFIRSHPKNVSLTSNVPLDAFGNFGVPKASSKNWRRGKRLAEQTFEILDIPRIVPMLGRCDLIHTNGGVIPLSRTPWVGSIENPSSFYGFRESWHGKLSTRKRLAKHLISDRCRRLLPYSEASWRNTIACLSEWEDELTGKMEIVHPAIDPYLIMNDEERKEEARLNRPVRFLFVGDHFFDKGGREVLRAFKHVRETCNTELVMVTAAPVHHREAFEKMLPSIRKEKNVVVHITGIPRRDLIDLYRSADVFAFPSYMDQVPFVLLEAMAAGLPIIGSNSYAIPEMVVEGQNGHNIQSQWLAFPPDAPRTESHLREYRSAVQCEENFDDVVEQLINRMTDLCTNPDRRARFGRDSKMKVKEGEFSIVQRNLRLSRIYSECSKCR